MIMFYPRDIGMWRAQFDFSQRYEQIRGIELNKQRKDVAYFHDRAELITFLKNNGVQLGDPQFPLEFNAHEHHMFGHGYEVIQWTYLGFFTETLP